MKYKLLTKEQFEALHKEFATFLAVLEIDKTEWDLIKSSNETRLNELLAQFSDLVWEDVLNKVQYLDHLSQDSHNLFSCEQKEMSRLVIRSTDSKFDFTKTADFEWFIDHSNDESFQYFKGTKVYKPSRNIEIFKIIEQGATISDGRLYNAVFRLIND